MIFKIVHTKYANRAIYNVIFSQSIYIRYLIVEKEKGGKIYVIRDHLSYFTNLLCAIEYKLLYLHTLMEILPSYIFINHNFFFEKYIIKKQW